MGLFYDSTVRCQRMSISTIVCAPPGRSWRLVTPRDDQALSACASRVAKFRRRIFWLRHSSPEVRARRHRPELCPPLSPMQIHGVRSACWANVLQPGSETLPNLGDSARRTERPLFPRRRCDTSGVFIANFEAPPSTIPYEVNYEDNANLILVIDNALSKAELTAQLTAQELP